MTFSRFKGISYENINLIVFGFRRRFRYLVVKRIIELEFKFLRFVLGLERNVVRVIILLK